MEASEKEAVKCVQSGCKGCSRKIKERSNISELEETALKMEILDIYILADDSSSS